MKKIFTIILLSCLFVLASCKCKVTGPQIPQKAPDVLTQPTKTVVVNETPAELPRATEVITDPIKELPVILKNDTTVKIQTEEVIIPKETEIIIPKSTVIKLSDITPITLKPLSEVILPQGTELKTSKINWYAILFFLTLFIFGGWWYIQTRQPDKNKDGYVDQNIKGARKKK